MNIKVSIDTIDEINKDYNEKYINNSSLYNSNGYNDDILDDKQISNLIALYDKMEYDFPDLIENCSDENNDFLLYAINDDGRKPIMLIVGGIHGDEKASVYGVMYSVNALLHNKNNMFKDLLERFSIFIVPCLNQYGFNNNTRKNENNVDLNRDWVNKNEIETKWLDAFIQEHRDRIKVILDSHNCGRNLNFYPFSFVAPINANNYKLYEDVHLKLRLFLKENYPNLVTFHMIPSPNHNTFSEYINNNGFIGHTIETPRCIKRVDNQKNYRNGCITTKLVILNTLLLYSSLIKN